MQNCRDRTHIQLKLLLQLIQVIVGSPNVDPTRPLVVMGWETETPSVDAICDMCLQPASRHTLTRHDPTGWLTATCTSGVVSDLPVEALRAVWELREGEPA